MKPIHVKRVIDFIRQHHPVYNTQELRALLHSEPECFIVLLNEAITVSGSTPKCAQRFIREFQLILKKEKPIMNNPKLTMRLVVKAKSLWTKAVQFFSSKSQKVAAISAAVAVIAFLITRSSVALAMFSKLGGSLTAAKDVTLQNIYLAGSFVQMFGDVVWSRVVAAKNFTVKKVGQIWRWLVSLFASPTDDRSIYDAA